MKAFVLQGVSNRMSCLSQETLFSPCIVLPEADYLKIRTCEFMGPKSIALLLKRQYLAST
jgi:hypothetical protein